MHDTGGTGRAAVDLAEALIVALEEACSGTSHRRLLPYLGMARAELAQCRPGGPGRSVRLNEVSVVSVHDGLEDLESLLTGIVMSLGTAWGLFRHYWVLFKLLMTVFATVILLIYMRTFRTMAAAALNSQSPCGSCRPANSSVKASTRPSEQPPVAIRPSPNRARVCNCPVPRRPGRPSRHGASAGPA